MSGIHSFHTGGPRFAEPLSVVEKDINEAMLSMLSADEHLSNTHERLLHKLIMGVYEARRCNEKYEASNLRLTRELEHLQSTYGAQLSMLEVKVNHLEQMVHIIKDRLS
jgi:hypothetical protein